MRHDKTDRFRHLCAAKRREYLGRTLFSLCLSSLFVNGCGGSGGLPSALSQEAAAPIGAVTIRGSVGDGPVVQASVTVLDAAGVAVGRVTSDALAKYEFTVPGGTLYPLIISASGGTDLVSGLAPEFEMRSVVLDPEVRVANVNPFSTVITRAAEQSEEGVTREGVDALRQRVIQQLNFGLDPALVPDPMATPVDEENVAVMVKASEVLAETLRRAFAALQAVEQDRGLDGVVDAIAADLNDGRLDGLGVGADPRITAAVRLASAQALSEAVRNRLQVGGAEATARLDAAIATILPEAGARTADVTLNPELLAQMQNALASARAVFEDPALEALQISVGQVHAGARPAEIEPTLPSLSPGLLETILVAGTTASQEQLARVNAAQPVESAPARTAARLQGEASAVRAHVDLSAEGALDWVHWGRASVESVERKRGVTPQIGNFSPIGQAHAQTTYIHNTYQWLDGLPTAQAEVSAAVHATALDSGFRLRVAADRVPKVLNLYVGAKRAKGRLVATLGEVPVYKAVVENSEAKTTKRVRLAFNSDRDGDVLTVTYTMVANHSPGHSGVMLEAATLAVDAASNDAALVPSVGNDQALVSGGSAATIHVLANDQVVTDGPVTVFVTSAPSHGTVQVQADNSVLYTPEPGFAGEDSFAYLVVDAAGHSAPGTVTLTVQSPVGGGGQPRGTLTLRWDPSSGEVAGYRIFYGTAPEAATTLLSDLPLLASNLRPEAPAANFPVAELGFARGEMGCFRVKAYNAAGESGYSEAVCGTF